jgi:hypothetical protein
MADEPKKHVAKAKRFVHKKNVEKANKLLADTKRAAQKLREERAAAAAAADTSREGTSSAEQS